MMHMRPNFRESVVNAFHRLGYELLPPPTGRSPSLEEGGLGVSPVKASGLAVDWILGLCGRPYDPSRARSKILIQPRVQGRNPARFNGGYGVPRGFKGEKSKSPPNPLGLAERVPRPADGGRSSFPSFLCRTSFYFPTHSRHTRHKKHMKHKSRFS